MDWLFILLSAGSGILFTAGDLFLKYWADNSRPWDMVFAFTFYILAGVALAFAFKRKEIAIAVAVLICFNLILVACIGFFVFKEPLGTKEIIGLSLAAVAVVLLNL